jgi:predicted RNA binding protein YcfA (HicA-like mRNA interferase family)
VPRKVRDLIWDLKNAGIIDRGGKGSHRNFTHPNVRKPVTVSGNIGDDALRYQERAIRLAIQESKK